jgi:hypothetical protein
MLAIVKTLTPICETPGDEPDSRDFVDRGEPVGFIYVAPASNKPT